MDTTGEVFQGYGVTSFPTTFMIDRDGNVFGYITGMPVSYTHLLAAYQKQQLSYIVLRISEDNLLKKSSVACGIIAPLK